MLKSRLTIVRLQHSQPNCNTLLTLSLQQTITMSLIAAASKQVVHSSCCCRHCKLALLPTVALPHHSGGQALPAVDGQPQPHFLVVHLGALVPGACTRGPPFLGCWLQDISCSALRVPELPLPLSCRHRCCHCQGPHAAVLLPRPGPQRSSRRDAIATAAAAVAAPPPPPSLAAAPPLLLPLLLVCLSCACTRICG